MSEEMACLEVKYGVKVDSLCYHDSRKGTVRKGKKEQ